MLRRTDAMDDVAKHLAMCERHGWIMFESGPELMQGVGMVMSGHIGAGLRKVEATIAQDERDGFRASADWGRLYLCELYLAILAREGKPSAGVLLRNAATLAQVFVKGPGRIAALVQRVLANPQFDREGHNIGRAHMILGLLNKRQRRTAVAIDHLREAQRIIGASGASPLLTRIDTALAQLGVIAA